jgi:hypothetical protein
VLISLAPEAASGFRSAGVEFDPVLGRDPRIARDPLQARKTGLPDRYGLVARLRHQSKYFGLFL